MKNINYMVIAVLSAALCGTAFCQAAQSSSARQSSQAPASSANSGSAPLQLNGIAAPAKLQFPPVDQKNFTAQSPTADEVNSFLKELWGYDPNRVWRVEAVQSTPAPNLSRVVIMVGEQGVSHTPATTTFFVTPDGKHAVAGNDVIAFGAHPFAKIAAQLEQAAGPYRGSASKKLMLVEFADLQCPHCKEAAKSMDQLATDFPGARVVFENFPLTNVHPASEKAAEYGICVAQQKGNAAFFQYAQAVYDNQSALANTPDQVLTDAATKAGADAVAMASCAAAPDTKAAVDASVKLGRDIGVDQTPLLFVNGRSIPIAGVPYNTIKQIVSYSAQQANDTSAK
ncbi:MAG: DsbA family protein [Acidobacteriaceae bacterium]